MTDDSVKDLLSRAFGEEPPLRIDRDEVLRQGRKRLRVRRYFEAGSVVTAVVVAAVGAAMLTDLADTEPDRLPPAASSQQASEDPSQAPASAVPTVGGNVPKLDPERLTAVLYEFGIVTANGVRTTQGQSGEPGFRKDGDQYVYEADVIRPHTRGQVRITITALPGATTDCAEVPAPYVGCEPRVSATVPVVLAHFEGPDGQRRSYAVATLDNGLRVEVTASNRTSAEATSGAPPVATGPVLTDDEVCALAVKAGLGV